MGALAEQPKYTTVIKVIAVAAKKEGRKTVGVKGITTEGDELWVNFYAEKAATLDRGESYEIQYQGDLKLVTSFKHITPHGHQAPPEAARPQAPQQQNGKKMDQYFKPTSPRDSKRMFICSLMNAMIQSRQVVLDNGPLSDAITMLADVYDRTIGKEDELPAG